MGVVFPLMIKVWTLSPLTSFFVILMWLGKSSSCLTRIWIVFYFGKQKSNVDKCWLIVWFGFEVIEFSWNFNEAASFLFSLLFDTSRLDPNQMEFDKNWAWQNWKLVIYWQKERKTFATLLLLRLLLASSLPLFIRKTFESLCVCVRKVTESKEFETLKLEGKLKLEMVDF